VCQCNYIYGDLLYIQVCSDPTPVRCNNALSKTHSVLLIAAVQNRSTAGLCQCNYTYEHLLSIQVCSDPTPVHCINALRKMHFLLLSAAMQNRSTAGCVSAITSMEICPPYRCAVTQQQRTAALVLPRYISHCPVLLCKTGLQQSFCHCQHTCGDLFFMQACVDSAAMHCSPVLARRISHFSVLLRNLR